MSTADLATDILIQIRDEMRKTREDLGARIDTTNKELAATNKELAATKEELSDGLRSLNKRQTETEVRLATEIVAVATAVNQLKDLLIEDRKLRQKVDDHEQRISTLEDAAH